MALWVRDVSVTFASLLLVTKDACCPVGTGVGRLGLERQCSLVVESPDAGTRLPSQVERWDSGISSLCLSFLISQTYEGLVVRK